jgi:hypothetical protein
MAKTMYKSTKKGSKPVSKLELLKLADNWGCKVRYKEDGTMLVYNGSQIIAEFREVKK